MLGCSLGPSQLPDRDGETEVQSSRQGRVSPHRKGAGAEPWCGATPSNPLPGSDQAAGGTGGATGRGGEQGWECGGNVRRFLTCDQIKPMSHRTMASVRAGRQETASLCEDVSRDPEPLTTPFNCCPVLL